MSAGAATGSGTGVRAVVDQYYALANDGDWDPWCDLFTEEAVIDEQLAGRIEGRETLRALMRGFGGMYAAFHNEPRAVVVDGDQVAVVSHISATGHGGEQIEADVANYFRLSGDRIAYMANFHDSAPFAPVLDR